MFEHSRKQQVLLLVIFSLMRLIKTFHSSQGCLCILLFFFHLKPFQAHVNQAGNLVFFFAFSFFFFVQRLKACADLVAFFPLSFFCLSISVLSHWDLTSWPVTSSIWGSFGGRVGSCLCVCACVCSSVIV